jgi:hypothetical protein
VHQTVVNQTSRFLDAKTRSHFTGYRVFLC